MRSRPQSPSRERWAMRVLKRSLEYVVSGVDRASRVLSRTAEEDDGCHDANAKADTAAHGKKKRRKMVTGRRMLSDS